MIARLPLGYSRAFAAPVLAGALALAACGDAATMDEGDMADDARSDAHQMIYEIDTVDISVLESAPLQIRISASGRTRTGGWTEPVLTFDEGASSGIRLVYRFEAVPPEGMATQALTPVIASTTYGPWEDRAARIIAVVAANNSAVLNFTGGGPASVEALPGE